jgi:hypothetical protein
MRKLRLALVAAIIVCGAVPSAAQTFPDARNNADSLKQIEYRDTYGHWQQCADIAGMCGVTTG